MRDSGKIRLFDFATRRFDSRGVNKEWRKWVAVNNPRVACRPRRYAGGKLIQRALYASRSGPLTVNNTATITTKRCPYRRNTAPLVQVVLKNRAGRDEARGGEGLKRERERERGMKKTSDDSYDEVL